MDEPVSTRAKEPHPETLYCQSWPHWPKLDLTPRSPESSPRGLCKTAALSPALVCYMATQVFLWKAGSPCLSVVPPKEWLFLP